MKLLLLLGVIVVNCRAAPLNELGIYFGTTDGTGDQKTAIETIHFLMGEFHECVIQLVPPQQEIKDIPFIGEKILNSIEDKLRVHIMARNLAAIASSVQNNSPDTPCSIYPVIKANCWTFQNHFIQLNRKLNECIDPVFQAAMDEDKANEILPSIIIELKAIRVLFDLVLSEIVSLDRGMESVEYLLDSMPATLTNAKSKIALIEANGQKSAEIGEFWAKIQNLVKLVKNIVNMVEMVNSHFRRYKAISLFIYSAWETYVQHTLNYAAIAINRIRMSVDENSTLIPSFDQQFEEVSNLAYVFNSLAVNFIAMCNSTDSDNIENIDNRMAWADNLENYDKFHVKLMNFFNAILRGLNAEPVPYLPVSAYPKKTLRGYPQMD